MWPISKRGTAKSASAAPRSVSLATLGSFSARDAERSLGAASETGLGRATARFHQAACGAEVEVDLETGRVELIDLHLETYAGRVINPATAELQNEGNVAFAVGQTLFEELVFEDGRLANPNLADYLIASFEDLPEKWSTGLTEHPSGRGQIHGLGETGMPPIAPAIANALYNACGARVFELPLTPERVLKALREASAE
jgi:CO/xanthine dehydrogenase Mo-binding subunit